MKRLIWVFSIFCLLAYNSFSYELPNLGPAGTRGMSVADENTIGPQYMQAIRQQLPLLNDPIVVEYVQTLGYRLVKYSKRPHDSFYFFVVKDGEINAFAGPGGYIGINTGLLIAAQSEGEVAAVMAHEIAHVTQRHLARTIEFLKQLQVANIAGTLAAIAIGGLNPQAGMGAAMANNAGSSQEMINTIRLHEEEADRVGMQTLANAGYAPQNMGEFFVRLQNETRLNGEGSVPELLQTHPLTQNRIAEAENRAHQLTIRHLRAPNPLFAYIRARAMVLSTSNPSTLARQLQGKTTLPARYAYALALQASGKATASWNVCQQLLAADPRQPLFLIAAGQAQQSLKHPQEALALTHQAVDLAPNDKGIAIIYAQLLLLNNQPSTALSVLNRFTNSRTDNESYLTTLAQAQGRSGQLAQAYETRAKLFESYHQDLTALEQLQQGLRYAKDPYTKARITNKIQQLKHTIELNKRLDGAY